MRICTKYATRMLDDAKLDIEEDEKGEEEEEVGGEGGGYLYLYLSNCRSR